MEEMADPVDEAMMEAYDAELTTLLMDYERKVKEDPAREPEFYMELQQATAMMSEPVPQVVEDFPFMAEVFPEEEVPEEFWMQMELELQQYDEQEILDALTM